MGALDRILRGDKGQEKVNILGALEGAQEAKVNNTLASATTGIAKDSYAVADFSVNKAANKGLEVGELKKTMFGNYTKKSVDVYIGHLKDNLDIITLQMEQQLKEVSLEKSNMQMECELLRGQLKETESSLEKINNEAKDVILENNKIFEDTKLENENLKKILNSYDERISEFEDLSAELAKREEYITVLDKSIEDYKKEINELNIKLDSLKSGQRIDKAFVGNMAGQEKLHIQEDIHKLRSYVKKYQEEREKAIAYEEELELREEEIKQLRIRLNEAENSTALLVKNTNVDKTENESLQEILAKKQEELLAIENNIRAGQEEILKIDKLLQERNDEKLRLESGIEEGMKKQLDLEKTIEEKMTQEDNLRKSLELFEDRELEAKESLRHIQEQNKELEQEIEDKKQESSMIADELDKRKKELEDLYQLFIKEEDGDRSIGEKINYLYEEYAKSDKEIKALEKEIEQKDFLISQYQDSDKESKLLRQDYEKAKEMIVSLKNMVRKIMDQMEKQSNNLKAYVSRNVEDQEEIKRISMELTGLKLQNIELRETLSQITNKYKELALKNDRLVMDLENTKNSTKIYAIDETLKKRNSINSENENDEDNKDMDKAYENAKKLLESSGIELDFNSSGKIGS